MIDRQLMGNFFCLPSHPQLTLPFYAGLDKRSLATLLCLVRHSSQSFPLHHSQSLLFHNLYHNPQRSNRSSLVGSLESQLGKAPVLRLLFSVNKSAPMSALLKACGNSKLSHQTILVSKIWSASPAAFCNLALAGNLPWVGKMPEMISVNRWISPPLVRLVFPKLSFDKSSVLGLRVDP